MSIEKNGFEESIEAYDAFRRAKESWQLGSGGFGGVWEGGKGESTGEEDGGGEVIAERGDNTKKLRGITFMETHRKL